VRPQLRHDRVARQHLIVGASLPDDMFGHRLTIARASGTSPSIFRLNRFKTYPYGPVISAWGIRVVLDMRPPRVDVIGIRTPPGLRL
jgi:hypothetical protein